MYYILKDKTPVICVDLLEWCEWYGTADRMVKKSTVKDCVISTFFLGHEHGRHNGRPVLFETMIFGGEHNLSRWRCCTWSEAEELHKQILRDVIGLSAVSA